MSDQPRAFRVALTGGIATGKSYCRDRFAALGAPIVDADVLARAAVAPGTPGLAAVVNRFGRTLLRPDGSLDRPALARLIFADATARRDLEALIHPEVYRAIEAWFAAQDAAADGPRLAMADIPLLFETGQAHRFDRVVVAACSPAVQLQRLMDRDGLSGEAARERIAAQLPIDRKRAKADYVIDTGGTFEDTDRQVDEVWQALATDAGRA